MNFSQAHQYLDSFINFETTPLERLRTEFKFERVVALAQALGDPQLRIPVIHVAGSKGKGSVCVLVVAVLRAAGYRVGLYTSPHLMSYRERIRFLEPDPYSVLEPGDIFADQISQADLASLVTELKPSINDFSQRRADLGRLSFFEVFTVMAFHYFVSRQADVIVCETGLGGRLDATNIARSEIAVITPISLEHTTILGTTRALIAREKAGIIKPSTRCVIMGVQDSSAGEVIKKRCEQLGVACCAVDGNEIESIQIHATGMTIDVSGSVGVFPGIDISLAGRHQAENTLTALNVIKAVEVLDFKVSRDAIYQGLREAVWPGRFEHLDWRQRQVVCDCAHNEDSIQKFARTMVEVYGDSKAVLIFGVSSDKDVVAMARQLDGLCSTVIVTRADHPRSRVFSENEVQELFPGIPISVMPSVSQAMELAYSQTSPQGIIAVTGSVFLVAQARQQILVDNKSRKA